MSNWKDELKNSQGGSNTNAPKLNFSNHFDVKRSEADANKIGFSYYVKKDGVGKNMFISKEMEGIYLGHAMKASVFCDNLGRNGGSYKTDYYWSNEKVVLFDPITRKPAVSGSMQQVEQWVSTNTTSGKLSKKQVLFLLTRTGLVTVTTNLSIAIDQLGNVRDQLDSHFIKLTPKLYEKTTGTISPRAKEYLGKFADRNPPLYAEIELSREINDTDAVKMELLNNIREFMAWKDYKTDGLSFNNNSNESQEPAPAPNVYKEMNDPIQNARPSREIPQFDEGDDDLPF